MSGGILMAELLRVPYTMTKRRTLVVTEQAIILERAPSWFLRRRTLAIYQRAAIVSITERERARPALGSKGAIDVILAFQNHQRLVIEWLTWADGKQLMEVLSAGTR
jgi:hypothetical protein